MEINRYLTKKTIIIVTNLAIVMLGLILYKSVLNGYFLSDDFVHVGYLNNVATNYKLLLRNFYSNWLDVPVTTFYRPFVSITLFMDYLIWGFKPGGYHLTNLIFHISTAIVIYLIAYQLVPTMKYIFSFFAAFLFLSFPTHPEAVYWIIGRVDTQATFFCLASLYSYIQYRKNSKPYLLYISLLLFVFGLGSKEIAVSLPIIIFIYELLIFQHTCRFQTASLIALKKTFIYGVFLVLYFVIRKLSLGTFVGGYNSKNTSFNLINIVLTTFSKFQNLYIYFILGVILFLMVLIKLKKINIKEFWLILISFLIGPILIAPVIIKWKTPLTKLFFPWNTDFLSTFSNFHTLKYFYLVFWITFLLIVLIKPKNFIKREFLFILISFAISLFPIAPVMYVANDLQGSRILYLPSVMFILGLVYLAASSVDVKVLKNIRLVAIVAVLSILCILQSFTLVKNLDPWVTVSQRISTLPKVFDELREKRSSEAKLTILLGIPDNYYGAYFLRNGYSAFLAPPILKKRFDNIQFHGNKSPEGYGSSLKEYLISEPKIHYDVYKYDLNSNSLNKFPINNLEPVTLIKDNFVQDIQELAQWQITGGIKTINPEFNSVIFKSNAPNAYIFKDGLNLNPDNTDYISITMKLSGKETSDRSRIYWKTANSHEFIEEAKVEIPVIADNKYHTYKVPISASSQWPVGTKITGLMLNPFMYSLFGEFEVKEISFIRGKQNSEGNSIWVENFSGWQTIAWAGGLKSNERNTSVQGNFISLISPKVQINPWATNIVSVTMRTHNPSGTIGKIYWITEQDQTFDEIKKVDFPVISDGKYHTYNVALKNEILWWSGGKVSQLRLDPPQEETSVELTKLEVHTGNEFFPKIQFAESEKSNTGIYKFNFRRIKSNQKELLIKFDSSQVPEATGVLFEITNQPFLNPNGYTLSKNTIDTTKINLLKGNYSVNLSSISSNQGLYYIRVIGINSKSETVGNFSDPIVILIEKS